MARGDRRCASPVRCLGLLYLPVHYLSDGGFALLIDETIVHEWTPDMRMARPTVFVLASPIAKLKGQLLYRL
jgi:hypothetical protein